MKKVQANTNKVESLLSWVQTSLSSRIKPEKAFSLVEMLIVLVIVSILAAMAVPLMTAKRKYEAKHKASTMVVLPIKYIGEPCTAVTSGTGSNQIAEEAYAILADRTSLLTCQSGSWQKY